MIISMIYGFNKLFIQGKMYYSGKTDKPKWIKLFLLSLAATINNVDETEKSDFYISLPRFY